MQAKWNWKILVSKSVLPNIYRGLGISWAARLIFQCLCCYLKLLINFPLQASLRCTSQIYVQVNNQKRVCENEQKSTSIQFLTQVETSTHCWMNNKSHLRLINVCVHDSMFKISKNLRKVILGVTVTFTFAEWIPRMHTHSNGQQTMNKTLSGQLVTLWPAAQAWIHASHQQHPS